MEDTKLRLPLARSHRWFWRGVILFWTGLVVWDLSNLSGDTPRGHFMRASILYLCWTQIVVGVSEVSARKSTRLLWRAGAMVLVVAYVMTWVMNGYASQ
ncbi:MAG TPA: hypothetical protein VHE78_02950 [Gemmatimonadaceae bacterium]|nr:hypothetical protein [Gemmatimonadaceae bacterium]